MTKRPLIVVLFAVVGMAPNLVSAASLSLAPAVVTIPPGETVTMSVMLDPDDDRINTVQGEVRFPTNGLEYISISTASSAIVYWGRTPTSESPGRITFLGGVPNPGVSGQRVNVFDVTVRGRTEGSHDVTIDAATVLADDGLGTDVLTTVAGTTVIVQAVTEILPDVGDPTVAAQTAIDDGTVTADTIPYIVSVPSSANLLEAFQVAGTAYAGDRVEIKLGTKTLTEIELPDVDGTRARLGILTPMSWSTEVTAPLRPGAYEFKIESVAPDGARRSSAVQTLTVHGTQITIGTTVMPTAVFVPSLLAVAFALVVGNILVIGRLHRAVKRSAGVYQRVDQELVALRARVDTHVATTAELDQMIEAIEAELPRRGRPAERLPRE